MPPSILPEQPTHQATTKRPKLAVVIVGAGIIEDQLPDLKEAALKGREAIHKWFEENHLIQVLPGEIIPRYFEQFFDVPDYVWRLGASPSNG